MSLGYRDDNEAKLKVLIPILDEYSEWYGRVIRQAFYPEVYGDPERARHPQTFHSWLENPEGTENIDEVALEKLKALADEMHAAAVTLIGAGQHADGNPNVELLDNFINLHDEFVALVRRIERDSLLADSGMDTLTGLRTEDVMMKDLQREMVRISRHGKPFCFSYCRIDGYGEFENMQPQTEVERVLRKVAENIKTCLRTYDDAYILRKGRFLLCLKHTEVEGALAAVDRLQRMLSEADIRFDPGTGERNLTMSFITAEPEQNEDISETISLITKDLDGMPGETSQSLQYFEVSPLQRYVRAENEG